MCVRGRILGDDGKAELKAEARAAPSAGGCRIGRWWGGLIKCPGRALAIESCSHALLTESDRKNIRATVSYGITEVMLPFVRNKEDLLWFCGRLLRRPGPERSRSFADREHAGSGSHKGAASIAIMW